MDIVSNAKARYATKAFNPDKKLSDADVDAIKELLRLSPSSVNSQPWHFILASSDAGKQRIAKATAENFAFNNSKILNASHVLVFCARTDIDEAYLQHLLQQEEKQGRFPNEEIKAGQHKGRSFFVDMHRNQLNDIQHWTAKQVYLNLGTVLLGAATLGIDAVPIEGFDSSILDKEFELTTQGFTSVVIVPLGYRADNDFNATTPKSRLDEAEIISEY